MLSLVTSRLMLAIASSDKKILKGKMGNELCFGPGEGFKKEGAGDEKKFSDTLRSLSAQKQAVSQKLEDLTGLFIHAKTDAERKKQFAAYRKALIDYNNLAVDELDQMKGIFGMQKMAHYMEVKIDITNKIKALISSPDKSGKDKKLLPAPKVIEE